MDLASSQFAESSVFADFSSTFTGKLCDLGNLNCRLLLSLTNRRCKVYQGQTFVHFLRGSALVVLYLCCRRSTASTEAGTGGWCQGLTSEVVGDHHALGILRQPQGGLRVVFLDRNPRRRWGYRTKIHARHSRNRFVRLCMYE